MILLRDDLAPVEFFMRKILHRYGACLDHGPDPGKCPGKCIMEILNRLTDKTTFMVAPWLGDVGVQAPASAE